MLSIPLSIFLHCSHSYFALCPLSLPPSSPDFDFPPCPCSSSHADKGLWLDHVCVVLVISVFGIESCAYVHSPLHWPHYCVVSSWLSAVNGAFMGLMHLTTHECYHTMHDLWPTNQDYMGLFVSILCPPLSPHCLHSGASHTTNHHRPDSVVGN